MGSKAPTPVPDGERSGPMPPPPPPQSGSADAMVRSALLRLIHLDSHAYSGRLRWSAVSDLFGIGSTSAAALCRRHGLDPEEELPESSMAKVARTCSVEMDDQEQGPSETCCKMWARIEEAAGRD